MTDAQPQPSPSPESELNDPNLDPRRLAQLAQAQPALWPTIRQHPQCYPELAAWIDQNLQAPQAPAPAKPTADQWAADFQATHGREPTMSEFQNAQAQGLIAKERDPSLQQMSAGFKQIAGGAKGLYNSRVAPAVERSGAKEFFTEKVAPAAQKAGSSVQTHAADGGSLAVWVARAPKLLPVIAFAAIIALFLPIASIGGYSGNFFSEDEVRGEGIFLAITLLVTIATSIWMLATRTKAATITAITVAGIGGVFGIFDGFVNMFILSGESGVAVGFGLVLLGLCGAAMLAAAVLMIIGARKPAAADS